VARGRLLPTVTADGADAWRAGPLDAADLAWLREIAACFPAAAHALAIPGSRPMRLRSPESLIRDLWDAIADTLARTAAAPYAASSPAFAAPGAADVADLAEWLGDAADGLAAGARLGLRVEPVAPGPPGESADFGWWQEPGSSGDDLEDEPDDLEDGLDEAEDGIAGGPQFRMVLQLRSTAEETLVVDAADLWDQPERVLARFGPEAETDLLLAMRRGAAVWQPLGRVLEQARPTGISLDDGDLSDLLGAVAEDLAGAGIEVLWPSSLLGDGLRLQAVVSQPGKVTEAGFSLEALLEFRWQLTLGGELLDPDEVNEIAEAKRPLIRLRGRWVTLDPGLLERLRRPPRTRMPAMEAVGAVLAGSAEIDGETVTVVAEGAVAGLAERLARLATQPPALPPPPGLEATLRPYQLRGLQLNEGLLARTNSGSQRRSRAILEGAGGRCVAEIRNTDSGNTENTGWSRGTQAVTFGLCAEP
jgi:SNF2 Helicase protein